MRAPDDDPRRVDCLLITGAPGAGKSTAAQLVAEALPRSAVVSQDRVNGLVVNGFVWALGEPRDEAARQVNLGLRNVCALTRNLVGAGFTVLVDLILADRAQHDLVTTELSGIPTRLVVLDPGAEECARRDAGRAPEDAFAFTGHDGLVAAMRAALPDTTLWIDTSAQIPEETAGTLLELVRPRD